MKRGFTLIELLAVIVLIALISLLTVTTVSKQYKDGKAEISNQQIKTIKLAAQMWGSENKNIISRIDDCASITVGFLKKQGYIDDGIKDPATNTKINDNLYINIKKNNSSYSYEIESKETTKCDALETGEI